MLVSPIAYEATGNPLMPDGKKENENLKLYSDAMAEFAKAEKLPFVDLFKPSEDVFNAEAGNQFTTNGTSINEQGDWIVGATLESVLFGSEWKSYPAEAVTKRLKALKDAIVDLQWHHQQDYRMVNGWYVYGSRSKPLDVETFPAEYAKIRKMCADRDKVVWALAQGKTPPVPDDLNPVLAIPPTAFGTKPYPEPEELRILTPDEALKEMKVPEGYKIQTFASEEDFPELAKPVQMTFDNKDPLWAACMPSYPQCKPCDPKPNDKRSLFADTAADVKA